jgi:maleate isomerase
MTDSHKLGILTPSSNTALEPLAYAIVQDLSNVAVHFSRLKHLISTLDKQSVDQFSIEAFLEAAELIADANVDLIIWGGTSGSWLGPDYDRKICDSIADEFGIPAMTSTLAILEAFSYLGATRYGLVVPYIESHTRKIIETYERLGLTCVSEHHLGLLGNHDLDLVPDDCFRSQLMAAAHADAETLAVVCTGVPTARLIASLEPELGVPIIDSIAVTMWKALRMLGIRPELPTWGSILGGRYNARVSSGA